LRLLGKTYGRKSARRRKKNGPSELKKLREDLWGDRLGRVLLLGSRGDSVPEANSDGMSLAHPARRGGDHVGVLPVLLALRSDLDFVLDT